MIVSYYTPGFYADVARQRLLPSLRALGLEHDVREVLLGEGWAKRTQFKAKFLMHMRAEHPGADLLWVDVDAMLHRNPLEDLRDGYGDCDLAAHKLNGSELLSGTLFLPAASRLVDALLRTWREFNAADETAWDQRNLAAAIEEVGQQGPLIVGELPPQYCYIHDTSRALHPDVQPVIEHFQASRGYRRLVARGEAPA